MSVNACKSDVLKTVRQLIRLTYEIPSDHLRPKRQFGPALRQFIIEETRNHQKVTEQETAVLLTEAKEQLKALQAIIDNNYHDEFPLSPQLLNPASNPVYYEKLVRDIAATDPNAKPTFKDYLKAFFQIRSN